MVSVEYRHEIPYAQDVNGKQYPRLTIQLANRDDTNQILDLDAYLDSGAEQSLFDGRLAPLLGLNLFAGSEVTFQPAAGRGLTARLHRIRLSHDALGSFDLEMAFSTGPIARNLLGRDFFRLVRIGFREAFSTLYVSTES